MSEEQTSIEPGHYTAGDLPWPTEIECIQVDKVYDFCYQSDTLQNVCVTIPHGFTPSSGTVTCDIVSCTCSFQSSTPVSSTSEFINATFVISCMVEFTFTVGGMSTVETTTTSFAKTITLCGPTGTTQSCDVVGTQCGPVAIIDGTACTSVTTCTVFTSTLFTQLLVPSYGFCTPAPCQVSPLFPCPPTPPAQCYTLGG